jgi:ATP-binding protein involved in chromosome partitioning
LVSESDVLARLSKVMDPELGRDIVSLGMVRDLRVEGDRVSFVLELTTPHAPTMSRSSLRPRRVFMLSPV